ncbi:hypothetical protein ACQ4M3_09785 [Leptolyngbya sp. AN03gr2]|uniref:hypothetical protein n=1 Tax=Leptolyngbya sp. AN03gr2 TaxID=3423364 RepID=UPI003D3204A9
MDNWQLDDVINEKLKIAECDNCGSTAHCGCDVVGIGLGIPSFSTSMSAAWLAG